KQMSYRTKFLLTLTLLVSWIAADGKLPSPPVARKIPHTTQIHGETRLDDYFWLREKSNPTVVEYLKAENEYADAVMQPTKPFQDALYNEMVARIKETDVSVPFKQDGYFYYTRTEQGKQYPVFCRKKGSLKAPEQVTLNLNEMAKGLPFFSVDAYD